MKKLSLKHYQDNAPANADHVLSAGGEYHYSIHDGIKHELLTVKGKKTGVSFEMGQKGWFILHRLKAPVTISTVDAPFRPKKVKNGRLKSLA